ncbi:MAG: DUF4115 domain-containing protein [bacterium]|nr:DUF4115 domain-containing protein [bacterium]
MTDDISNTRDTKEEGASEADYLSFKPGQRLKKARELRGLSVEQVAKELHLSLRFVTAMEADDYKQLPEPAFVRGYMRRYAQLVKLSADDIAGKFDQCYAADGETPEPDSRPRNPIQLLGDIARPRLRVGRLLSLASVGLIVMLVLGFLFWNGIGSRRQEVAHEPAVPVATVAVDAPLPVTTTTVAAVPAVPASAPSAEMNVLPSPAGPAMLPAPVASVAPPSVAPSALPAASDTLVITLVAESWVSVRDARQMLVSELKRGGQTLTLKGEAPFTVSFGNAPAVTLSLNGKPVDLKPYTQGAVASFTLKR